MSKCVFQKQAFSYIVTMIKIKKSLLLTMTIFRFHQLFWWYSYRKFLSLHFVQVSSVFGSETIPLSYLSWLWIVWCIIGIFLLFSHNWPLLFQSRFKPLQFVFTCYLKSAVLSQLQLLWTVQDKSKFWQTHKPLYLPSHNSPHTNTRPFVYAWTHHTLTWLHDKSHVCFNFKILLLSIGSEHLNDLGPC